MKFHVFFAWNNKKITREASLLFVLFKTYHKRITSMCFNVLVQLFVSCLININGITNQLYASHSDVDYSTDST
jgi:hypothetical protein